MDGDGQGMCPDWAIRTQEQLKELQYLRRMVTQALRGLRRHMRHVPDAGEQRGYMADMLRLSQIQVKLIPLEQGLLRELETHKASAGENAQRPLSEEEWAWLEQAVQKRQAEKTPEAGTETE